MAKPPKRDITKLPEWVQDLLAAKDREIASLWQQISVVAGKTQSRISFGRLSEGLGYLPSDYAVNFDLSCRGVPEINTGRRGEVRAYIQKTAMFNTPYLYVSCDGALGIFQSSTNCAVIVPGISSHHDFIDQIAAGRSVAHHTARLKRINDIRAAEGKEPVR